MLRVQVRARGSNKQAQLRRTADVDTTVGKGIVGAGALLQALRLLRKSHARQWVIVGRAKRGRVVEGAASGRAAGLGSVLSAWRGLTHVVAKVGRLKQD